MSANQKVFILGPARSGTSITYYAMREVFDLPGWGESHVLPIFQRILHQFFIYCREFRESNGNFAKLLAPPDFRRYIILYIRDFYESHYRSGSWVDKTPGAEAILGVPLIQEIFPDARIIVTRRTGVEVVQSFRRKFSSGFLEACQAWANSMSAIKTVRNTCSNFIEVDQYELANSPAGAAERIAEYLGRADKKDELAQFFSERRTDQRSDHNWRHRLTLDAVDWTEQEKEKFIKICAPLMGAFRYPLWTFPALPVIDHIA